MRPVAARVILVEPDEQQRREFLAAIQGFPFKVCKCVDTNEQAVDACGKLRPHIIVMQLVSGKMGTIDLMNSLWKKKVNVKVVVSYTAITAYLLSAAYDAGAASAIKLPFSGHSVVEGLTFAMASVRHEKLSGPIVRLEYPIEVFFKTESLLAHSRIGFCERLGLEDMDLNTEKPPQPNAELRLELLFPRPMAPMKFTGTVKDLEQTRPQNWCAYITLKHVSDEERKIIGEFLVKAAKWA